MALALRAAVHTARSLPALVPGTPRLAALLPCTCPQGRIAAAAAAASAAVRLLLLLLLLLLLRLPPPGGRVGISKLALYTECAVRPSLRQ